MTATIVFSRRGVHVRPKQGTGFQALFVPTDDQVVVLRDVAPSNDEIMQRVRSEGRLPLWREKRGQILVYGLLPNELREIRQALSVWLVEDFVPPDSAAYFFVFEGCVVHGVKEIDDERRVSWRSTVLPLTAENQAQGVANAVADMLLRTPAGQICVAIECPPQSRQALQQALEVLGVKSVEFSTLRPGNGTGPLYRHRDFTMPMVLSALLLALLFLGTLGYAILDWVESARLAREIEDVQRQIRSVQISQSLGYVREPQAIISSMKKNFEQQPSAIIDAAARFGRALGELREVSFKSATPENPESPNATGLMTVSVKYNSVYDKLLVNQESAANRLLPNAPWIRSISSVPQGNDVRLYFKLQISAPPGASIPSATSVFQPVLAPPPSGAEGEGPAGAAPDGMLPQPGLSAEEGAP